MTFPQKSNIAIHTSKPSILEPGRVLFLDSTSKEAALKSLIACLADSEAINDAKELEEGIFHREELMSTGIGFGIAVPHVRLVSVQSPVMSVGICRNTLRDYESMDDKPVNLIFMIAAGIHQHADYLGLLSNISSMVKDDSTRNSILQAADSEQVYGIINRYI